MEEKTQSEMGRIIMTSENENNDDRNEVTTEKINTEIIEIDPNEVKLLETNARFMRHETFQQLVDNIKKDGRLTQLPFCTLEDDGKYMVLSGNHRVQASIEAGLKTIEVMVTHDKLSEARKLAIQLSHNSISGEDDPAILKSLYEEIENIDFKVYSGLDDKTLELLEKVQPESIAEVNLEFQNLNIVFLPTELEKTKENMEEMEVLLNDGENWLVSFDQYDDFMDSMESISSSYDVKNVATTFLIMMDMIKANHSLMIDGWYDKKEQEAKHNNWIPIETLLNNHKLPAKSASIIEKALNKMMSQGDITSKNKWQGLEYLAADYLAGE